MAQKPIGLRLDEGLLERIDRERGSVSRAAWIAAACEALLSGRPVPSIEPAPRSSRPAPPMKSPPQRRPSTAARPGGKPRACPGCGGIGGSHQRGCSKKVAPAG